MDQCQVEKLSYSVFLNIATKYLLWIFLVAISAAITTPLDVAKTRIMLSNTSADKKAVKISVMLKEVYRESGTKG